MYPDCKTTLKDEGNDLIVGSFVLLLFRIVFVL